MAREFAESFYNSRAWRRCRDAYYSSQEGICEKCKGPGVIVHHKIPLTPENINNPEITLGWDNLMLVCIECHNSLHGNKEPAIRKGLMFDMSGNLVERNNP